MVSNSNTETDVIFQAGTNLVQTLEPHLSGYADGPERALLGALLFDGVQAYLNYHVDDGLAAREECIEALSWVHSEERDYVFSFINVCQAIGIDPDYLRLGLINVCLSKRHSRKRIRRSSVSW